MGALALGWALCLLAATTPANVLTYAYTYERNQTDEAPEAYGVDKMDPSGGGTFIFPNINQHYRSPSFDAPQRRLGIIAVEVVRQEADGGLVLRVDEPAPNGPRAEGQTCVAFADTTVVCDPSHPVSVEAQTLLRLMGRNFVDPSHLDGSRHWRIVPLGPYGTTADYTIGHVDGTKLHILESALQTQAGTPVKTEISATIDYDAARSMPLTVEESTIAREQRGVITQTTTTHVALRLQPASP